MKHRQKSSGMIILCLWWYCSWSGLDLICYKYQRYNGAVKFHDSFYYLKKQGFATALGLASMFIVAGDRLSQVIPFAKLGYVTAIVCCSSHVFIGDE